MPDPSQAPVTDEMLEDCLQALQRLLQQDRSARLEEVAAFARLTPESTGAVLAELEGRGLVERDPRGCLVLTREGQRQAAGVLRRHRLSERLFTDVLGLPWDQAHEQAMRLEHSISPVGEARLANLLDNPATCPHGSPIPSSDGRIPAPESRTLDRVAARSRVRIQQIANEEAEFLRYLASLGLLPEAEVTVEEVAPFGGPLLIQVGGARYALGREVAGRILVRDGGGDGGGGRRRRRRQGD
ncbi:MAG: metal-dependent transcriptional regulator [candidate division NC10 bacterium]|nr:metal-dependent transcriptional regulator [candidate division NC10 bacterium]